MRGPLIASLVSMCPIAVAQPELLDPVATLYPGNGQLVITGEIVYQGRRGTRDAMTVRAEAPRSDGGFSLLTSAPAEIGVFALAPSGESRLEPGGVITLRVLEGDRTAIVEHVRVDRPTAPARPRAEAEDTAEVSSDDLSGRRAGGMYIGYRMRNRSPGPIAPGRGYAGRSVGVEYDVVIGAGGNFDANFSIH